MARRVVWSEPAWQDLEQIVEYIAEDSPEAAVRFLGRAREASRSLATLALRGRVVPELGEPDLREILLDRYRLLYEIHDEVVEVHAVIHGARDLAALWQRDRRSR